ncbi:hypothetical protein QUF55_07840 [Clostridiaceae bacterium HSG29]|nr:hypothetical protein [Clostridiaceae bacterium HSG29]
MIKAKDVKMIDLYDWDKLVCDTYNKIYSLQQQDGCKSRGIINITIPDEVDGEMNTEIPEVINHESKMCVNFNTWLDRSIDKPLNPSDKELEDCNYYWGKSVIDKEKWKLDKSNINMFWTRNFYPNLQAVANDLHKKGLLDAGAYAIEIDW